MKFNDPNETIFNLREKISNEMKIGFLSAIIFGFITHMYYITNNFPNADTNLYAGLYLKDGWMVYIGRWLARVFDHISSYYILPWIDGFIAIILLAIITVLVVKIFDIKKRVNIICLSAALVTFPSVMANFGYINYADTFMWSYLFAVLAIYILNRDGNILSFAISVILIACSLGIYQAFICVSILLCLFILIKELLNPQTKLKYILKKAITFVIAGISGMGIYFVAWKVIMYIRNIKPANYKGLTDYKNYSLLSILKNIKEAYRYYFQYFFTDNLYYNPKFKITCYIILNILAINILVILIVKRKLYLKLNKFILLIMVLMLLPLAYGFIKVIAPAASVSPLTIQQIAFFIPMIIILLEQLNIKNMFISLLNWIAVCAIVLIVYSNILISNVGYVNLQLQYEKAYSSMQRIMDRILESEYYNKDIPIFISGDILGYNYYTAVPQQKEYLKGLELVTCDASVYNSMFAKESFIRTYFGIYIPYPSDEIQESIIQSEEYQQMPMWPAQGCIKLINNVLVVKMY